MNDARMHHHYDVSNTNRQIQLSFLHFEFNRLLPDTLYTIWSDFIEERSTMLLSSLSNRFIGSSECNRALVSSGSSWNGNDRRKNVFILIEYLPSCSLSWHANIDNNSSTFSRAMLLFTNLISNLFQIISITLRQIFVQFFNWSRVTFPKDFLIPYQS